MKTSTEPHLSSMTIAIYSAAAFSTMLLTNPVNIYLPQLYVKELGLSFGSVGLVITITQVLDALSQQIIGMLSDRTRTRWGPRKPWVAFGATLSVVGAYFLLKPPPGIGIVYFIVWKIVYDFAWTSKNVAYSAWGAELGSEYKTRSKIVGMSNLSGQLGNIANTLLPIVVAGLGLTATSAFSMKTMGYYFVAAAVAIPVLHAVTLFGAPQGMKVAQERPTIFGMVDSVKQNKPFWRYLAAFMLSGLGLGVTQISFTFYDSYLGVGKFLPYMLTAFSISIALSIPFWVWCGNKIGRHKAYCISLIVTGASMLGYFFIDPDKISHNVIAIMGGCINVVMGIGVGCLYSAAPAIMGDIVDYGTLKTGVRRTGSYFAFYLLINKVAIALGAGMGFMLLSLFGYSAKPGAVNDDLAKMGMLITVALIPMILKSGGGLLMWWFPLDERRHDIIRRRLAQKAKRQTIAEASTYAPAQTTAQIGEPKPA
jgi:Na+/melibiose symporter-like transporter